MDIYNYRTLSVTTIPLGYQLTLQRPDIGNAMNLTMVEELGHFFHYIANDEKTRVLVIQGAGKHFCSGGDISEMKKLAGNEAAIFQFNRQFGDMLLQLQQLPCVVICLLHGNTLGGGLGICCVADISIAIESSYFAMPEVRLGVTPAQIAPFVVARAGLATAQLMALSGTGISAPTALNRSLIHYCETDTDQQQQRLQKLLTAIGKNAPQAVAETKRLLRASQQQGITPQLLDYNAKKFSQTLAFGEGRAGAEAFALGKNPDWLLAEDR